MTSTLIRRTATGSTLAAALLLAACGESSTAPGGESELITRVTLTLTPNGGGSALTAFIDDPDGNGPQSPSAQQGALTLAAGTTYAGTVKFENRLKTPVEDITEEVEEEANEHRVFYTVTGSGVTITTTDLDPAGRPLGLRFNTVVGTGAAGAGTVRVVLCHYDDGPKPTTATTCTGDTDIDVTFNYTVQN